MDDTMKEAVKATTMRMTSEELKAQFLKEGTSVAEKAQIALEATFRIGEIDEEMERLTIERYRMIARKLYVLKDLGAQHPDKKPKSGKELLMAMSMHNKKRNDQ